MILLKAPLKVKSNGHFLSVQCITHVINVHTRKIKLSLVINILCIVLIINLNMLTYGLLILIRIKY